jgi:DNA anti-recombination protein RmuC
VDIKTLTAYPSLEAETPTPSAVPNSFLDWGIAIAILLYILREGTKWFQAKDAKEEALTDTLITDLRTTAIETQKQQALLLEGISLSQKRSAESLERSEKLLKSLFESDQREMRELAVVQTQLNAIFHELTVTSEKVNSIHHRLDSYGVPSGVGK